MIKHNGYMKIIKITLFEIFLTSYYYYYVSSQCFKLSIAKHIYSFLLIKEAERLKRKERNFHCSILLITKFSLLQIERNWRDRGEDVGETEDSESSCYQLQMKVDFRDRGGAHIL